MPSFQPRRDRHGDDDVGTTNGSSAGNRYRSSQSESEDCGARGSAVPRGNGHVLGQQRAHHTDSGQSGLPGRSGEELDARGRCCTPRPHRRACGCGNCSCALSDSQRASPGARSRVRRHANRGTCHHRRLRSKSPAVGVAVAERGGCRLGNNGRSSRGAALLDPDVRVPLQRGRRVDPCLRASPDPARSATAFRAWSCRLRGSVRGSGA